MKMPDAEANKVLGELAETERDACIPVVLRYSSLPKLISGDLRVEDADRLIEDQPT